MDAAISGTPHSRPEDTTTDPQVVTGRDIGGWTVVEAVEGYSAKIGHFTATGERVPALQPGSMGTAVAEEGPWRHDHRTLRG